MSDGPESKQRKCRLSSKQAPFDTANSGQFNSTSDDGLHLLSGYMSSRVGGEGGVIALSVTDDRVQIGYGFNSNQMSWAYAQNGEVHYGVNAGEDVVEDL